MGSKTQKKVGILGGGFNPVHNQHIINAEESFKQTKLDEVWFIPTKHHAFKGRLETIDDAHRIKMLELAIQENPNFKIDTIELEANETNYTIDTIIALQKIHPNITFSLIIGGDNISSFHKWKDSKKILQRHEIICCKRLGDANTLDFSLSKYSDKIHYLELNESDISSTFIRNALKDGESIRYYVPNLVYHYIKQHKLYE